MRPALIALAEDYGEGRSFLHLRLPSQMISRSCSQANLANAAFIQTTANQMAAEMNAIFYADALNELREMRQQLFIGTNLLNAQVNALLGPLEAALKLNLEIT